MISMTGYSYKEKSWHDFLISIEIKGYNSRYLDININLPAWLSSPEMKIRYFIMSCCTRGKIEINIRVREFNVPVNITVNKEVAKAYLNTINNLADDLGLNKINDLNTLLKMEGILEIDKNRDDDIYWQRIEPLLHEAVLAFNEEKKREGKNTKEDILENLAIISSSVKLIASYAPVIENNIKENIKSRFYEMLGNNIDENRIYSETASQLLKYTISEEISRLNSHISEFYAETERNEKAGKKLDFLSQEINREINTIGSKSNIIEVSGEVVKMKEALENIREQLRNVE